MANNVINPYINQEVLIHRKFISHLGIAYLDLKFTEKGVFKTSRTILRKICGQFNYGTLVAVLGSRKSGKTTLLKCLSGRGNDGIDYETQIYLNREVPVRAIYLEKTIAHNILLSLTIEEALDYSFRFRNSEVPSQERAKIIRDLLKDFGLTELADATLKYCTPEEQLRAVIAMSLSSINRPNMIFLDEPLSDLDAVSIDNIIHLMKQICRNYGITFICSVGQILDSDILAIFDKLYVLSRGGLCIYEGSVEHLGLFLRESDVIITSKIETPIERLMKVGSKPDQTTIRLANQTYSTRNEIYDMANLYGILSPNGVQIPAARFSIDSMGTHLGRCLTHKFRLYWKTIVIQLLIVIGLTFAMINAFHPSIGIPDSCFNRTSNYSIGKLIMLKHSTNVTVIKDIDKRIEILYDEHLIESNLKFLYTSLLGLTFFQLITSIRIWHDEINIAVNEHRNGWINISVYFLIKNIVELIVPLGNTLSFTLLAYFLTDQITSEIRILSFFFAYFMGVLCSQSLGFVIGIISVFNEKYVNLMIILFYLILIIFSGYLIPLVEMSHWIRIIANISFIKQAYELAIYALYGFDRCNEVNSHSFVLGKFDIDYPNLFLTNALIISGYFIILRFIVFFILIGKSNKTTTIERPVLIEDNEPNVEANEEAKTRI